MQTTNDNSLPRNDNHHPYARDSGEEICFCSAYYDVKVFDKAIARLQKRKDIQEVGGSLLWTKGKPPMKQFKWLKRGPSKNVELKLKSPVPGVPFEVSWLKTPDSKPIAVLADITVDLTSLTLSALSRSRLEAAKKLLAKCLGNLITLRREDFFSQDEMEKMYADKLAWFQKKVKLKEEDVPVLPKATPERKELSSKQIKKCYPDLNHVQICKRIPARENAKFPDPSIHG